MNLIEVIRTFCILLAGFSLGRITNEVLKLYAGRPRNSVAKDNNNNPIPNWFMYLLTKRIVRPVRCGECGIDVDTLAGHENCPVTRIVFVDRYGWTVQGPEKTPER